MVFFCLLFFSGFLLIVALWTWVIGKPKNGVSHFTFAPLLCLSLSFLPDCLSLLRSFSLVFVPGLLLCPAALLHGHPVINSLLWFYWRAQCPAALTIVNSLVTPQFLRCLQQWQTLASGVLLRPSAAVVFWSRHGARVFRVFTWFLQRGGVGGRRFSSSSFPWAAAMLLCSFVMGGGRGRGPPKAGTPSRTCGYIEKISAAPPMGWVRSRRLGSVQGAGDQT